MIFIDIKTDLYMHKKIDLSSPSTILMWLISYSIWNSVRWTQWKYGKNDTKTVDILFTFNFYYSIINYWFDDGMYQKCSFSFRHVSWWPLKYFSVYRRTTFYCKNSQNSSYSKETFFFFLIPSTYAWLIARFSFFVFFF